MPQSLFYLHVVFALLVALMLVLKFTRQRRFNRMGDQVWQECLLSEPATSSHPPEVPATELSLNVVKFPRLSRKYGVIPGRRAKLGPDDLYWAGRDKLNYMSKALERTRRMNDVELTLWLAVPVITALFSSFGRPNDVVNLLYVGSFLFALKGLFAVIVGEGDMLYTLSQLTRLEKKYPIATFGFVEFRLHMLK